MRSNSSAQESFLIRKDKNADHLGTAICNQPFALWIESGFRNPIKMQTKASGRPLKAKIFRPEKIGLIIQNEYFV